MKTYTVIVEVKDSGSLRYLSPLEIARELEFSGSDLCGISFHVVNITEQILEGCRMTLKHVEFR